MSLHLRGRVAALASPWLLLTGLAATLAQAPPSAGDKPSSPPRPDYPPFAEVTKGYEKIATPDGKPGLYTLYVRKKDNQMLAELPKSYARDKHFIALTVSSGERYAGLQAGERYVYWRRYDKRLALVEPNVATRSTGDAESKSSVKRLFTDRILLDVPIVALSPSKSPIIDMDALLVGQATKFFPSARGVNPRLAAIKTKKAFPDNVEISFEVPIANGQLKTLHYSISKVPDNTGYKPRVADERVGYFTTSYTDLGKYKTDETRVRFINRWQLKKADPSLKLSPPEEPIIFYIEHTTPKRYRYWVKKGVLAWNQAFEKIGIRDAIVVYQQDANPKLVPNHMDKDPEDVRFNFVRWLNNNVGTAIGPSRVHPLTGQILDADIILTDGWIRYYETQYNEVLPRLAMEGFSPRTLSWLNSHPNWDPRILLAPPAERPRLIAQRAAAVMKPYGGHPAANIATEELGDDEYDGLVGRHSQLNGMCLAADGKAFDLAVMRMTLAMLDADLHDVDDDDGEEEGEDEDEDEEEEEDDEEEDDEDDAKKKEVKKEGGKKTAADDEKEKKEKAAAKKKDEGQKLDGVPEEFIGPLIAELVAHEVGHTLGLRHNFKASSIYSLDEISSEDAKGKPHAGSVMDYLPINMRMKDGEFQGEHTMTSIGPYDMWAIEYGYTLEKDLKPVLQRVAEPELVYGTDEDTWGPDPRARRYDFSKDPLDYAKDQMKLAKYHRERLLEKWVKEGDSWAKARRGYEATLSIQTRALSMMANWIGGTFLSRDKKGDKDAREPLEVVPVERQREALDWTIENAFEDESFGLSPDLIRHLVVDQWLDDMSSFFADADFPVHDRVMGIQGSTLTMLMNPDTLRLVYDNELRTSADRDILTLPEMLDKISSEIWRELETPPEEKSTDRKPWISSLRRNLQREHMQRLIDLTLPTAGFSAAYKPISNLALHRLRGIHDEIAAVLQSADKLDAYSLSHLEEAKKRIEKSVDADYIYNVDAFGGGGFSTTFFFHESGEQPQD